MMWLTVQQSPSWNAGLGDEGDPLIWWPGAIEDLVRQVDGEVEQLARAVSAERGRSGTRVIGDRLLTEFKAFYNQWKSYKDGLGWFGYMTGATVDRVKQYRKQALSWYDKIVDVGATTLIAPKPPTPKEGFPWVKAGFILVSVGVGAYAVSKLTDLKKLVQP